jgi:hypothetical protein
MSVSVNSVVRDFEPEDELVQRAYKLPTNCLASFRWESLDCVEICVHYSLSKAMLFFGTSRYRLSW